MQYPPAVAASRTSRSISAARVRDARARGTRRTGTGSCEDVFPIDLCTGILTLPICPPVLGRTDGTRGSYNAPRCFITPDDARQIPDAARRCPTRCSAPRWRG